MKRQLFNTRRVLRFSQFSRKGYALFSVLGREVLVGVLAVATLQNAKAEGVSIDPALSADSLTTELRLAEVTVTGSRAPLTDIQLAKMVEVVTHEDVARATGSTSINDVFKLTTGVDVRQRGGFGVQSDISLRGGNFDQITLLLNGVNISSPHTGHLSADFPISVDDIARIEVLEGGSSRVYGSALNGVINIVTKQSTSSDGQPQFNANLGAGNYGYFTGSGSIAIANETLSSFLSAGYTRSDGATDNSAFSSSRLFWTGAAKLGASTLSAQLGYSYKPYEANTFYGASSTDQWESNERLMAALNGDIVLGKLHLVPQLYWNRWHDHYQWHRYSGSGENYHQVDATGESLNAWFDWALGRTSLGGDLRQESIWSTKLGLLQAESEWRQTRGVDGSSELNYKYHDSRTVASAFLEHNILLRAWTISFGATAMHTALSGWGVYPGVDVAYRPNDSWKLFASANMSMRLPTFTDLYYSGTNIEGNSELKPEKSSDLQLGVRKTVRGFVGEAALFYSHKNDMIDWVTYAEAGDEVYHSVNFQMNNWGAELNLSFLPQELWGSACNLRKVSAKWAYINEDSDYDVTVLSSKYAMDYLRNKLVLSADGRIWNKLNLSLSWRWQDRVGEGNEDYSLLDGKLSWDAARYSLYLDAANILNKTYYDYSIVKQPGFTFVAGVKLNL